MRSSCIIDMHILVIGVIVFYIAWTPLLLYANGRPELIDKGNKEYELGNFERAYEYYMNAGINTPEISFRLASIISYFRREGFICEYNAYVDLILEHLQYIVDQDSIWLDKIIDDTIFSPIHRTVLYNIWKGSDIECDSSIPDILSNVSWYLIVEPVTSTDGEIIFRQDGSVFVDWGTYYEYDEKTQEFLPRSFGKQEGYYEVKAGEIKVWWTRSHDNYYNTDLQNETVFTIILDGVWGILKETASDQNIFYDIPDECNT